MSHTIMFVVKAHVPLAILYVLFFTDDLGRDQLFGLLALNVAFLLTSFTYMAFFKNHINAYLVTNALDGPSISWMFSAVVGWLVFYITLGEYVTGLNVVSFLYVVVVTWLSWFFALQAKPSEYEVLPIVQIMFEVLTVGMAAFAGYALFDLQLITSFDWVLVSLVLVNMSLLCNEIASALCRAGYISKKTMGSFITWYICVLGLPFFLAAFR